MCSFKINDQIIDIEKDFIESEQEEISLRDDNNYALEYIFALINNGFISLDNPLNSIQRIENDGTYTVIYPNVTPLDTEQTDTNENEQPTPEVQDKKRCEWGDEETFLMLDRYETYMKMVGPMKKFKNKKRMWEEICKEIKSSTGKDFTPQQTENRYKTLLKRKKDSIDNNRQTGREPVEIPFEEELNRISSQDDSIKPEVLRSLNNVTILKEKPTRQNSQRYNESELPQNNFDTTVPSTSSLTQSSKKNRKRSIQDVLIELHKEKEENRERRHREKLAALKELFEKSKEK